MSGHRELKKKPKIGVDIDGVLINTQVRVLEKLREKYGTELTKEDFKEWNAWECGKFTKEEFLSAFDQIDWRDVPPMDSYAQVALRNISGFYQIDLITAMNPKRLGSTKATLTKLGYEWDEFITVDTSVASGKAKYATDYVLFVEDGPHQAQALTTAGAIVLLYDQVWNRDLPPDAYECRVVSWREIEKYVFENRPTYEAPLEKRRSVDQNIKINISQH